MMFKRMKKADREMERAVDTTEYCDTEEEYDGDEEYYGDSEEYGDEEEYFEAGEGYDDEGGDYEEDSAVGDNEIYYKDDFDYDEYDIDEPGEDYNIAGFEEDGENDPQYDSEIIYEEELWELEPPVLGSSTVKKRDGGSRTGFFSVFGRRMRGMEVMDRIMLIMGVIVLILTVLAGGIFMSNRVVKKQVPDFTDVGKQLEGINLIGEYGLLAVADAEVARLTAASVVSEEEQQKPEYQESGYETKVTVEMNLTSIQKDLKIKFVNKRTGKLVPNVPFVVNITAPDGSTSIWSDDDMDGIIYKTGIVAGKYKVAMEGLTDSKYSDYSISADVHSATVEEEIVYKKVDVANEVKQENEVNATKEDTKVKEITESVLKDTVEWVESTAVPAAFDEVLKGDGNNDIPDPLSLMSLQALNKRFWRMTNDPVGTEVPSDDSTPVPAGTSVPTEDPESTDTPVPTDAPEATDTPVSTDVPETTNTSAPTDVPEATDTPAPTDTPESQETSAPVETLAPTNEPSASPVSTPSPVPSPIPTSSPTPSPSPAPVTINVSVAPTTLSGPVGVTMLAQATVKAMAGSQEKPDFQYTITAEPADPTVASATVDSATGKISVKGIKEGNTKITITVEQAAGGENPVSAVPATAVIDVTVTSARIMTLDKTSMTITTALTDQDISGSLTATVTGVENPIVTAVSSDANVAIVNYEGNVVNIRGVKAGSTIITVSYTEGDGVPVIATCTVTVKTHPKNDNDTKLQTKDGRQVYVRDGDNYREAVWSDYYAEGKTFYVRKDIKYTGWQTLDGKVYYYTADGVKVTGEQVIQGAKYTFASDGSLLVGSNGSVGIDVSKWNGTIDWNAVKNSGVSYVIIRCGYRGSSEGKLIEDSKFEANIKGATAAGLKVGIYFFSQAVNEVEAVEEASMVLGLIKGYTISYPVFLDVEASGGRGDKIDTETRTAVCTAFCQTIKNEGYTAGVYSNKTWLEKKIDAGSLGAYKIWLAQYAEAPTYTGRYELWQYRDSGRVNGVSGNVDMNISYLGY